MLRYHEVPTLLLFLNKGATRKGNESSYSFSYIRSSWDSNKRVTFGMREDGSYSLWLVTLAVSRDISLI